MRLTTLILTVAFIQAQASGTAQTVSLSGKNLSLKQVFAAIEEQTGYVLFNPKGVLSNARPVTVSAQGMPLMNFLALVFEDQPLKYVIRDRTIIVTLRSVAESQVPDEVLINPLILFTGIVQDTDGVPLEGATVTVKGTQRSVKTDAKGQFKINAEPGTVLVISFVGYDPGEVTVRDNGSITTPIIRLKAVQSQLEQVVINTGMFLRDKTSFTGAATTFTGEQLKEIGNKNILQSLKSLDPAFIVVENNRAGSNPNALPTLEIRGRTAISTTFLNDQFSGDPNQPLFILDGFETTLDVIYDLDMNRVETVTILKDAASTALYGSKAANGVVVVVTKRPKAGELRLNYSGDFSADMPDFSSYNLMDAAEKLEFERLAGVYIDPNFQWRQDELYNSRLAEVQRGVNTYWLSEPVRTGFSNRHSVQLAGGNDGLLFSAGVNYRHEAGVMKGSRREGWGGNFNLTFRKHSLNITNLLNISGSKGVESPYGSFSEFSRANPYFRKYAEDGSVSKYLYGQSLNNPLFNASLFSINQTKQLQVNNNLNAVWTFSNTFRLTGGVRIGNSILQGIVFLNPENTMFDGTDIYQKGSYRDSRTEVMTYSGYIMASYAKVSGKHQFNGNIRSEVNNNISKTIGFSAVGFPFGTNGNPAYAFGYTPFSRPASSVAKSRSLAFLGTLNYSFDQRFLLDATYRLDGSSVFGANRLFKSFTSGGVGWNLHNEKLLKGINWLTLLKLRGDIGLTGNTNLGQFVSTNVYSYMAGMNHFGQMLDLTLRGNPDLEWQNTLQESYGIDFSFLSNRVTGYVERFKKVTDPLVISASSALPSSAAVSESYMINAGRLTTEGWNVHLRVSPVYNLKDRIIWSLHVSGAALTSTYSNFGNKLDQLNKQQVESKGLLRFMDGNSPDDLWAVISKGIDPATGNELFLSNGGKLTSIYSTDDIVKVGNGRPRAEGVLGTSFTYKSVNIGVNMRYRIGGYVFNSAVFNKVENITRLLENQDKRALYERWKQPGDITPFKAIQTGSFIQAVPMSSRFIQKDTHLIGESVSIGWRINRSWIRRIGLNQLSMNFYMNDIFRIETLLSERGIDYPFARSCSFSINASF